MQALGSVPWRSPPEISRWPVSRASFGDGAIFAAVAQAVELEGVHAVAEA